MDKSGNFILEYSKIFINLTSLFLALSVTFVDKVAGTEWYNILLLMAAWIAWLLSIYKGATAVRQLVNIAANEEGLKADIESILKDSSIDINEKSKQIEKITISREPDETVYSPKIKSALHNQVIFFFIGVGSISIISMLKIIC